MIPSEANTVPKSANKTAPKTAEEKSRLMMFAGGASVATVLVLIAIKTYAYFESESVSVLGSLIDSVMDSVVSIMTFLAIRMSLKPADDDHRSGHGKAEGLAALIQAGFISGSCIFLLFESLSRFTEPHQLARTGLVMVVMVASMILTTVLIMIQNYAIRHTNSLAVEADKAHYSTDFIVNGGVLVVMAMLHFGLPQWIDPVCGIGIVAYMGHTAFDIGSKGIDMLMDKEVEGEIREHIERLIFVDKNVKGMHDLRITRSGTRLIIAFDIELPGYLSLTEAHDISRDIEIRIIEAYPDSEIMIHKDPYGDPHDARHGDYESIG